MVDSYAQLATLLARGISQGRMYRPDHPNVTAAAVDFRAMLGRMLMEGAEDSFVLGMSGGRLVHDGHYLAGPTIVGSRLTGFADLLEAGGFAVARGVTTDELTAFFALGATLAEPCAGLPEARALFAARGITRITPLPRYREETPTDDDGEATLARLVAVYRSMFDAVERAHLQAGSGAAPDVDASLAAGESLVRACDGGVTDIMALVEYPDFDSFTVGHSVRVAMLTVLAGRAAGIPPEQLSALASAALLHDVGKGRIPQEILFKPGRLDEDERRVIETHPALGAALLLETRQADALAVAAAWGHHRRWDGGGYPKMPLGSATSALTQLVHVCDVFEALTAVRPYKRAMTPRDAYEIILRDRGAFAPAAIDALRRAVGLFPPGSRVVLASGHRAVVTAPGSLIDRPRVRVTHDADGAEVPEDKQPEIDLASTAGAPAIRHLLLGA